LDGVKQVSAIEKLAHLFDKWDKVKDEFLEARSRERMILDVMQREGYHIDVEGRPE
jgi:hypothetical protein